MEWLASNAVNIITSVLMLLGGISFAFSLDHRLKNIEREQAETKSLVVVSARLEERITNTMQIVLSQGKRLDRLAERIYGRPSKNEEDDNNG